MTQTTTGMPLPKTKTEEDRTPKAPQGRSEGANRTGSF